MQSVFLAKYLTVSRIIPFFFSDGSKQCKIFYAPNVSGFQKLKIGELSIEQLRYLEVLIIGNCNYL